jgi:creatinine amidohydrolase
MTRAITRRTFMATAALAASGGLAETGSRQEGPGKEVRLERMRPAEIEAAMKACPTLYQPIGTIEWHGVHNIVGLDAVKAHHLCVRAAQRGGGLVAPALFGGVGGMDEPHTFVMEPENDVHSVLLRSWLDKLCREAARQGFRAVIVLTGHYGAAQQIVVRDTAVRASRSLGIPVLGTPEYILALDAGYLGDHAAWGETSLMMYLDPDSVAVSRLGEPPHRGVGGRDPREATKDDGRRLAQTIIERLAAVGAAMPQWDATTLARFQDAEAAIVNRQMALAAETKRVWAAWRHIGKGALAPYGKLLAESRFEEVAALAKGL